MSALSCVALRTDGIKFKCACKGSIALANCTVAARAIREARTEALPTLRKNWAAVASRVPGSEYRPEIPEASSSTRANFMHSNPKAPNESANFSSRCNIFSVFKLRPHNSVSNLVDFSLSTKNFASSSTIFGFAASIPNAPPTAATAEDVAID